MDELRPDLQSLEYGAPRRGRRRRRGISLLPAMFTLGNLMCGFASLAFSGRGIGPGDVPPYSWNFMLAGLFILLAMVFDMFDGFVARLTKSASDFGAELDSLADMVSFGVAPAFLSIHLIGQLLHTPIVGGTRDYIAIPGPFSDNDWLRLFWIIAGVYVACTALRLARFNVTHKTDISSHMAFRGLPSPGAAAIVAGSVMFFESLGLPQRYFNVSIEVQKSLASIFPYLLPVMLLIAALLMVSRFAYAHLINRFVRGRKRFRTVVGFFLLVMMILWQPQITVLLGIYIYTLSAPVLALIRFLAGKSGKTEAIAPTAGGNHGSSGSN